MRVARSMKPRATVRLLRGGGEPGAAVSDEAIIAAFATGDARSADLLYDRLIRVVDAALYRVLGRRETDWDDLVQATFEQIILTLTRGRFAGGCSLNGWASSIASHVALNTLRGRTRARRVFAPDPEGHRQSFVAAPDNPEAEVIARREVERMRAHLAVMDLGRAQTLLVHDVFGFSLAETARLTGVSLSAAQSRLVRARRELEKRMNAEVDDDA